MSGNHTPINFFKGHPSYRLLPREAIVEAASQLLTPEVRDYDDVDEDRHPLTYGPDEGSKWVRTAVAKFTNDCFRLPAEDIRTKPEHINLTAGASYGVMNILEQTTLPHTGYTKQAFIVSPTYFLINETFIDAGFGGKMTAIEEVGHGKIDMENLERKLQHFDSLPDDDIDHSADLKLITAPNATKKIYRYVIYLIPTYSNPGGQTYSMQTRVKLVELARKHDMLIISDDVYDLLKYDDSPDELPQPLPRMTHVDRMSYSGGASGYGNTVSNATFSKLIAPGLRFGYQESVNDNLAYQLSQGGANVSGGTPSQLNSMIVGTLLQNGRATEIICDLRKEYKVRATCIYESIKKYLPRDTIYEQQLGGYFSWCTLPDGYNSKEIGKELKEKFNVTLANGSSFEVIGDERNWGDKSVRLSSSFIEAADIETGIKLWGTVCEDYAKRHNLEFR
ncbi:unnamed protein product [Kluyveromyces dobzhanskii CBS 2104]|uniref:WGS project CCBQ000000000 data, contig 00223 n=1 Tax=Kluyveromyces dobzhanskii CBS 2104 TaxID=1427455 RepID=A0A0A8L7B9_9SACH|nr:unnamed protein product [Kluyveromyces dobzhanskii CBS 2104]